MPLAVLPWATYLALPISVHPLVILLPSAALLGMAVSLTAGSFKSTYEVTRAARLCKAVCRSSVLQGIKSSIQRRNRLDDRSYRRPIKLMIALSVVHTAIE